MICLVTIDIASVINIIVIISKLVESVMLVCGVHGMLVTTEFSHHNYGTSFDVHHLSFYNHECSLHIAAASVIRKAVRHPRLLLGR